MSDIKINWIHFKNFKGFKDYKLELNGNSAKAIGANGSGKTSLADGFLWLLFGKDMKGLKLNPKPLDEDENEILGLDPTVESEIVLNGTVMNLRRVQEERWTTKRGELDKTRGNDTTKYFIDEVPKKEKEWKEFIESIAGKDEQFLQMLIDPSLFMRLEWKDRRDILVSLTGLTDEEIIKMDPELKELEKILGDKTIDEKREMLKGQKKKVKQEIEGLPGRIQENADMIERLEISELKKEDVEQELKLAQKKLEDAEQRVIAAENGDGTLDFKSQELDLKDKLSDARNQFLATSNLTTENLQKEINEIQARGVKQREEQTELQLKERDLKHKIDAMDQQRELLLNERNKWLDMTFDEHKKECVMCGQSLPEDQIAEMVEKFNIEKSNTLESNMTNGKALKVKRQELEIEIKELSSKLEKLTDAINATLANFKELDHELKRQQNELGTFEDTDEYKSIKQSIDELQQKILNAKADSTQIVQEFKDKRDVKKKEVNRLIELIFKFDQIEQPTTRIKELREKDAELKKQNSLIEKHLFLIDEFTRKKVKYLTDSINSRFETVQFKLFDIQKNGGLKEVCEATYRGVGYSAGASTGERGKSDMDIVSVLQKGFDISMPVFLDNAESITTGVDFDGQLIQLFAKDEEFRVEVDE